MNDLMEKIRQVYAGPQLASFATITEDGKPWVRYVMTRADEELTIRFATFVSSRKVSHIRANPEVHLTCGFSSLVKMQPYLQIQARAEVTTDKGERHAYWHDQLEAYFKGPDDPNLAIVIVRPYRIELMALGSMVPEMLEL
jgi:general stress protein 26